MANGKLGIPQSILNQTVSTMRIRHSDTCMKSVSWPNALFGNKGFWLKKLRIFSVHKKEQSVLIFQKFYHL